MSTKEDCRHEVDPAQGEVMCAKETELEGWGYPSPLEPSQVRYKPKMLDIEVWDFLWGCDGFKVWV